MSHQSADLTWKRACLCALLLVATACGESEEQLERRAFLHEVSGTMLPVPKRPLVPKVHESPAFHEYFEELSGPFASAEEVSDSCLDCHDEVEEQLEEVEVQGCLECHAKGALDESSAGLTRAAQSVGLPGAAACTRCHEEIDLSQDVHHTSHDFRCHTCHVIREHRMTGSSTHGEGRGELPRCTGCHVSPVHGLPILNLHARRMDCNACHHPVAGGDHKDPHRTVSARAAKECSACHGQGI